MIEIEERVKEIEEQLKLYSLGDKIDYLNTVLRNIDWDIYELHNNKTISQSEKVETTANLNDLYNRLDKISNEYCDNYFEQFKIKVLSMIQFNPIHINIKYLKTLLKEMEEDDKDKDIEIFLKNELRKLKIKKLLNG